MSVRVPTRPIRKIVPHRRRPVVTDQRAVHTDQDAAYAMPETAGWSYDHVKDNVIHDHHGMHPGVTAGSALLQATLMAQRGLRGQDTDRLIDTQFADMADADGVVTVTIAQRPTRVRRIVMAPRDVVEALRQEDIRSSQQAIRHGGHPGSAHSTPVFFELDSSEAEFFAYHMDLMATDRVVSLRASDVHRDYAQAETELVNSGLAYTEPYSNHRYFLTADGRAGFSLTGTLAGTASLSTVFACPISYPNSERAIQATAASIS